MPWNLNNAPISIYTTAKLIPYWKEYNGNTGKIPVSPWPHRALNTERRTNRIDSVWLHNIENFTVSCCRCL